MKVLKIHFIIHSTDAELSNIVLNISRVISAEFVYVSAMLFFISKILICLFVFWTIKIIFESYKNILLFNQLYINSMCKHLMTLMQIWVNLIRRCLSYGLINVSIEISHQHNLLNGAVIIKNYISFILIHLGEKWIMMLVTINIFLNQITKMNL